MSSKASTSTAVDGKESTKETTRTSQRKRANVNDATGGHEPRKKSAVGRKPKTGRLSQLMSIPMDVLMEIFGHLHPLDLLHVARTTKAFRRVLMHRSSLFVWKAALSAVPGLPDCPPDLSEPQWVNLAFDAHCSLCLRPNIRTIDWVLRVRLCIECTKQHITGNVYKFSSGDYHHINLTGAVPHRYGKRRHLEFLRDEYQKVYDQYLAIENLEARLAFFKERQQMVQRINEHARLCVAWASAQGTARSDELERLKSSRHKAIVDKLVALGWGEEIDKIPGCDALINHKLVKVPQLLTDRIWAKIGGTMIEYMEKMKANRLDRELEELRPQRRLDAVKLLQVYKAECAPFTNVMPEPLDFCAFGAVEDTIDQSPDVVVDSKSFLHLRPELDGMVKEWRRVILKKFVHEVAAGVVERSNILDDNPLNLDWPESSILQRVQLACIVFACVPCKINQASGVSCNLPITSRSPQTEPLWFPRVLGHRCLTKPRRYGVATGAMRLDRLWCYRQRWSCDSVIKVDREACKAAVVIIKACQMDPRTAAVDDMDGLDARLECLRCLEPYAEDPTHVVFGWRSAVKHQREHHPSDVGDWRLLTTGEAEVARCEENIMAVHRVPSDWEVWLCLHCIDSPAEHSWMTVDGVRDHVKSIHDIGHSQVNRDYVKDFAAPELYTTSLLSQATMVKFPA